MSELVWLCILPILVFLLAICLYVAYKPDEEP